MVLERELVLVFIYIDAMAVATQESFTFCNAFQIAVFSPVCLYHHRVVEFVITTVILRVIIVRLKFPDVLMVYLLFILVSIEFSPLRAATSKLLSVHLSPTLLFVVEKRHSFLHEETFLLTGVLK